MMKASQKGRRKEKYWATPSTSSSFPSQRFEFTLRSTTQDYNSHNLYFRAVSLLKLHYLKIVYSSQPSCCWHFSVPSTLLNSFNSRVFLPTPCSRASVSSLFYLILAQFCVLLWKAHHFIQSLLSAKLNWSGTLWQMATLQLLFNSSTLAYLRLTIHNCYHSEM